MPIYLCQCFSVSVYLINVYGIKHGGHTLPPLFSEGSQLLLKGGRPYKGSITKKSLLNVGWILIEVFDIIQVAESEAQVIRSCDCLVEIRTNTFGTFTKLLGCMVVKGHDLWCRGGRQKTSPNM